MNKPKKPHKAYSIVTRAYQDTHEFRSLSRDARYLWFMLCTSPKQLLPGVLYEGPASLAESCDMTAKEFDKASLELTTAGLAFFEPRLCFVPQALQSDPCKNPAQYTGWLFRFSSRVPPSALAHEIFAELYAHAPNPESKQKHRDSLAEWSRGSRDSLDHSARLITHNTSLLTPNSSLITHNSKLLRENYVVPFPKAKRETTSLVLSEVSGSKQEKTKRLKRVDPRVQEAFDYWVKVMGKQEKKTFLTAKRQRAIEGRLLEGYSLEDDIKRAIDGCSQDAFSMGANDRSKPFNDIELICRSGERLEGFRDALDAPGGVAKPWAMPHGMKEWADKVLTKELFPEANGGDSVFWDATKKGWYHFTKEPLPLGTFTKLELAHEEICARFDRYLAELNNPKGSVWRQT